MTNWKQLLTKHRIAFVDSGPSTAKDNVYVHCVYCGTADTGFHLGISTRGKGWGCWRNPRHRGRNDARLLAALLRIPYSRAAEMLGQKQSSTVDDDDLLTRVRSTLSGASAHKQPPPITMPREIRPLSKNHPARMFNEYLVERGYAWADINMLCLTYSLHYAMKGPFSYRLVFPIYDEHGIATMTGRSIADREPRYLTLSAREDSGLVAQGLPQARGPITDYLFDEQHLFRFPPRTLVVCEGPFDAMRVDWAHRTLTDQANTHATCLFGKSVSQAQFDKLANLSEFTDEKFLLLDPDARFSVFEIVDRLAPLGFKPIYLDDRWEDPGDRNLPLSEIRSLIERERKNY